MSVGGPDRFQDGLCNPKYDIHADHGLMDGDQHKSRDFLYLHNWISFVVFTLVIIVAQFWYQVVYDIFLMCTDECNQFPCLVAVTLFATGILLLLTYFVFKIPIAAAFTF